MLCPSFGCLYMAFFFVWIPANLWFSAWHMGSKYQSISCVLEHNGFIWQANFQHCMHCRASYIAFVLLSGQCLFTDFVENCLKHHMVFHVDIIIIIILTTTTCICLFTVESSWGIILLESKPIMLLCAHTYMGHSLFVSYWLPRYVIDLTLWSVINDHCAIS